VSTQDLVLSFNELELPDYVLELTSQGLVGQVGEKDKQRVENSLQESSLPQVVGSLVDDVNSLHRLPAGNQ
jgi:hypothetical protein